MVLILNIVFALLGGWLAYYLCLKARIDSVIAVIVGVLVGLVVFSLNLAAQVL